jgi:hypothetical protein
MDKKKLDKERKEVAIRVKKFEEAAREIRDLADKLHHKMEQLHLETIATRERARAARLNAQQRTQQKRQASGKGKTDRNR